MKTTIDKLMTWYSNESRWNIDVEEIQLTNTMSLNGTHAQNPPDDKWGTRVIQLLWDNKDIEVEVFSSNTEWDVETIFKFNENEICFTSVTHPFSKEEC